MRHLKLYTDFILESSDIDLKEKGKEIEKFKKKIENTGKDIEDKEIQFDLLDKILDADFDLTKVDVKKLKENSTYIKESVGGVLNIAIETLESFEVGHVLAKVMGIDEKKVMEALALLKKFVDYPFDLVKKFFFKVARVCRLDIESSKIVGYFGLGLLALICLVIGIIHFPGLLSGISLGFSALGFLKLFWGLVKVSSSIYSIYTKVMKIKNEGDDESTSGSDFLDKFEKVYKSITGNKIDSNFAFKFDKWFDGLSKQIQQNISKKLSKIIKEITKPGFKPGSSQYLSLPDVFVPITKHMKDKEDAKLKESFINLMKSIITKS